MFGFFDLASSLDARSFQSWPGVTLILFETLAKLMWNSVMQKRAVSGAPQLAVQGRHRPLSVQHLVQCGPGSEM